MSTRRTFLTQSSALLAGLSVGARSLHALSPRELSRAPAFWLPDVTESVTLQTMAVEAMSVAQQAGAVYADIRIGEQQTIAFSASANSVGSGFDLNTVRGFGLRALVDGVWGEAYGATLTREHLAACARRAVAHAKHQVKARSKSGLAPVELTKAPIVSGEWSTPFEIDPFAVSVREHYAQLEAQCVSMKRVVGVNLQSSLLSLSWIKELRVFASTEGTLLTQRATRAIGDVTVTSGIQMTLPHYGCWSGGFELLLHPELVDRIKFFADDVVRIGRLPHENLDVGRYTVVMDGAHATHHVQLLAQACEADRALGTDADASGTTFLSPVRSVLNAPSTFSPLVTLAETPTDNRPTSWKWDAEGIAFAPASLITKGRVVDYTASRELLPRLESDRPLRGASSVRDCQRPLAIAAPEVTFAPNPETMTLDELCREVGDGVLISGGGGGLDVDAGLYGAFFMARIPRSGASVVAYRVKRGQVVGLVPTPILMYRPSKFWKDDIAAVGDASTVHTQYLPVQKGMPWQTYFQTLTAPALVIKNMDIGRDRWA